MFHPRRRPGGFRAADLSNTMWAIAKMHVDEDEYLPMDVVRVLEGHIAATIDDFIPQGVSNPGCGRRKFQQLQGFSSPMCPRAPSDAR